MYRQLVISSIEPYFDSSEDDYSDDDNEAAAPRLRRRIGHWTSFSWSLALNAVLHPMEYASVLMQLGYEPIPPRPSTSLLGRPILVMPNVFQYAAHIGRTDGFFGCYRGLVPRMLGQVLSAMYSERFVNILGMRPFEPKYNNNNARLPPELAAKQLHEEFRWNLKRDVVMCVTGCVIAQPFRVIAFRMMGQFVGRETLYDSVISSIREILVNEGVPGLFAGLWPQMLSEVSVLLMSSAITYAANKYLGSDRVRRKYNGCIARFLCGNLMYPLQVVATVMCVSGARLAVARQPMMSPYGNWLHCLKDLRERGELMRAKSLFIRTIDLDKAAKMGHFHLPSAVVTAAVAN